MAQISIDAFDRIRFLLVVAKLVGCAVIKSAINGKGITVILLGLQSAFTTGLHIFGGSVFDKIPAQNAPRSPIYNSYDVDFVFFLANKDEQFVQLCHFRLCG